MVKPVSFQQSYVALNNIPYLFCDLMGHQAITYGGVLSRGQLVWMRGKEPGGRAKSATAFVDGIGLVSVDPHWLVSWQPDNARREKH